MPDACVLYVLGSESLSGVPLQTVPEGRGVRLGVDQDERDENSRVFPRHDPV